MGSPMVGAQSGTAVTVATVVMAAMAVMAAAAETPGTAGMVHAAAESATETHCLEGAMARVTCRRAPRRAGAAAAEAAAAAAAHHRVVAAHPGAVLDAAAVVLAAAAAVRHRVVAARHAVAAVTAPAAERRAHPNQLAILQTFAATESLTRGNCLSPAPHSTPSARPKESDSTASCAALRLVQVKVQVPPAEARGRARSLRGAVPRTRDRRQSENSRRNEASFSL
jgi:hypothetical protein